MMFLTTRKLLLSELRVVPIPQLNNKTDVISDECMVKVMTINEELNNLGYTLNPKDCVRLAATSNKIIESFLDNFRYCLDNVKAKPMYPDFPNQVLSMDEATFRMHQLIHYFTTYGIEYLAGMEVSKGWLPNVEETEKTECDDTLLSAKTIQLIDESECAVYALEKILSKRERMTNADNRLIKALIAEKCNIVDIVKDIDITFKENLYDLFNIAIQYKKYDIIKTICQHTGDIWKCISYMIKEVGVKRFKTSQKRHLVNILESYPIDDFEANLILSNKKSEEVKILLNYLSYNRFSNSLEHKEAVRKLRNNELSSWEGKAKKLIFSKDTRALEFISKRPGMMIRMITLLLRNGYDSMDIIEELSKYSDKLSTQTLVTLLNFFMTDEEVSKYDGSIRPKNEQTKIVRIVLELLSSNLAAKETVLKDKKVFLDFEDYDLTHSLLLTNDKSDEGGYIRSGLAYKIPEEVKVLRFFVYWNDKHRVDIDLHASLINAYENKENIGWNSDYKNTVSVFSGDVTHSDAAEFIDINIDKAIENEYKYVTCNINSYTNQSFKYIETCFVGMMGVNNLNEYVKLYDAKNCFFSHDLKTNHTCINYGYIDIQNRCLVFIGKPGTTYGNVNNYSKYNLWLYLTELFKAQNVTIVDTKDDTDYTLIMAKPNDETEISLVDNNFFLD